MVGVNFKFTANPGDNLMLRQQGGGCFYCGATLPTKKATKDHLFPHNMGKGRTLRLNKVMACQPCNVDKANREPTPLEIERAQNLYRNCGLPAFAVPA